MATHRNRVQIAFDRIELLNGKDAKALGAKIARELPGTAMNLAAGIEDPGQAPSAAEELFEEEGDEDPVG